MNERLEELLTEQRDGIPAHRAPLPPRLHRCEPWSRIYDSDRHVFWFYCACGAVSREGWVGFFTKSAWLHKNSRRQR